MSEIPTDVDDVAAAAKLDTAPVDREEPVEQDELGTRQRGGRSTATSVLGWLRWAWYSLTSMRTALILLFLLALAAVPGSVLPQHASSPLRVRQYYAKHPTIAPIINAIGGFDVFGSPWFAAVYLLLFISLAGCVLPRSRRHVRAMRARAGDWQPAVPSVVARRARRRGGVGQLRVHRHRSGHRTRGFLRHRDRLRRPEDRRPGRQDQAAAVLVYVEFLQCDLPAHRCDPRRREQLRRTCHLAAQPGR